MLFDLTQKERPFENYELYMEYLFACVNEGINRYLERLKEIYATGQGDYKNVLYPDLEIAHDTCLEKLNQFRIQGEEQKDTGERTEEVAPELLELFGDYLEEQSRQQETEETSEESWTVENMMDYIQSRAAAAREQGIALPFYEICKKLEYEHFTVFCLTCGILSSTQTDYAGVFQVVNENGGLPLPTIESAAKLYFGDRFSITGAYGDMSVCLEQLLPILNLQVRDSMPFSTVISPDKRMIDYLFGRHPLRLDENYVRFMKMLTQDGEKLDPILANQGVLDAMEISYGDGVRIFSWYGDEGSGRKFFIRQFCKKQGLRAVSINCKKLFVYDFSFVDQALWAVTRECILTGACCCLDDLVYREEEKDKFFGYMDLAFSKLTEQGILVFAVSKEKLSMREMTREEFTELELPTPSNQERENCWKHFPGVMRWKRMWIFRRWRPNSCSRRVRSSRPSIRPEALPPWSRT